MEVIETVRTVEPVVFQVTLVEKIKKMFAPVVALTMMISLSIESQTVIIFFVMAAVPVLLYYYWLSSRFRVVVSRDTFTVKPSAKIKEKEVHLKGISQIELRYDYVNRLVEPSFIFSSETGNVEISLPQAYFLEKSVPILMALKQRCPDKTILLKWRVPKKNQEELIEIQKGTPNQMII